MEIKAFGDGVELREVPAEFVLIKRGQNKFTINGKQSTFDADEDDLQAILKEFNDRKKDVVVDYDHATLDKRAAAIGDAPAAGWVKLESSDKGLIARVVNWTKKATDRILNGEYRYSSPVIHFIENRPRAIQSIGLTNHPAIHEQMPLVAANDLLDGTAILDDSTEFVLSNWEAMARGLKSTIGELQTELKNTLEGMNSIGSTNEAAQRRVASFSDGLFQEELKAFADVMAMPVRPLEEVQKEVVDTILMGQSIDGILADNTISIGARAQKLANILSGLNMKIGEYQGMLNTAPEETKPQINAILDYLNQLAAEVRAAIMRLDAVTGEVPMADMDDNAAKQNIMDYIKKVLKSVPMSAGKVLEAVSEELKGYMNLPANVEATIKAIETPAATVVKPGPTPEFVAQMNDLGLTGCSTESELYTEVSKLASEKKAKEKELAGLKKESEDKITALNDSIATIKAEQIVDKVISTKHGKITEAMRSWAIGFAKRDPKGFEDHVANAPVAFSDLKVPKDEGPGKKKKAYSPEQIKYAQAFGNTPEEVYE